MASTDKPVKNLRKTDSREERLAAALRANLRRRKAQERGRDAAPAGSGEAPGEDAPAAPRPRG